MRVAFCVGFQAFRLWMGGLEGGATMWNTDACSQRSQADNYAEKPITLARGIFFQESDDFEA